MGMAILRAVSPVEANHRSVAVEKRLKCLKLINPDPCANAAAFASHISHQYACAKEQPWSRG